MPSIPPSITALPAPPDPSDRSTYNARAYPWSVAQQTLATEVAAVADNVFDNATEAAAAAALAVPAAAAAEAASNATLWVSGTPYAAGVVVWSPINALSYRRKTAGAGTTDPSADSANWASLAGGVPSLLRSARTSNTMLTAADKGKLIDITSGTFSQNFDAAATLGVGWWCILRNSGTGGVTLDPNAAETIDGVATKALDPLQSVIVQCDGAALRTVALSGVGNHFVTVTTGNGHGSTNTAIRRFTTTQGSAGTAITYADSATLGASFTINEAGIYEMYYLDAYSGAAAISFGISLNSTQLSTGILVITAANRMGVTSVPPVADTPSALTRVLRLASGDVIRPHTDTTPNVTTVSRTMFSIRKVGL